MPQTILASILTPHNHANAHFNLDNSSLNKCPKPSWQAPQTGNAQIEVAFLSVGLPWVTQSESFLWMDYSHWLASNFTLFSYIGKPLKPCKHRDQEWLSHMSPFSEWITHSLKNRLLWLVQLSSMCLSGGHWSMYRLALDWKSTRYVPQWWLASDQWSMYGTSRLALDCKSTR